MIPVIDLSDLASRKSRISKEILNAGITEGMFQIRNHDIPRNDIDDAYEVFDQFFVLPEDARKKSGAYTTRRARPSGSFEETHYLEIGPRLADWPDIPGFQEKTEALQSKSLDLCRFIMSVYANELGLEDDFDDLSDLTDRFNHGCNLTALHSPLDDSQDDDAEFMLWDPKTDPACLAVTFQREGNPSLQVSADPLRGPWTDVEDGEDLVTVHVGDMLHQWSERQLLSRPHRLPSKKRAAPQTHLTYYFVPNLDKEVKGTDLTVEQFLQSTKEHKSRLRRDRPQTSDAQKTKHHKGA